MTPALSVWLAAVALLQLLAAAIEYNAIRQRVNGANGLFLFTAGVLSLASLPLGGALLWYLAGWRQALLGMAVAGGGGALLFWGLLQALDRCARAAAASSASSASSR